VQKVLHSGGVAHSLPYSTMLRFVFSQEPMVDIYYPIIADSPDWVVIPMDTDEYIPSEHRLGGLLSASIYWRDWIKGILSEGEFCLHCRKNANKSSPCGTFSPILSLAANSCINRK
jgi:hypothetical protein